MNIDEIIRANKHFKESRLPSLYSDFERLKLLNPEGYEANIEAWTNLLLEIIKHYKDNDSRVSIPTVNPDLKQILSIPIQGKPRSLNLILQELVSRKFLVPYSHYISVDIPYFGIIDNSLSIYNRIKLYLNGVQFTPNERYLSWDLTCQLGNKCYRFIEERRSGYTSKLYNEETLYTFLKTKIPSLSYIDFIIVLKYLVRDIGKCSVSKVDEVTYVKFDISTLTKEDIDIINLMASINKLTDRKQELMAKITDLKMQISTIDNKNTLKHLLKLKFLVNKSLDLTLNSLNQLNTVMIKIDDSNMNLDVYHQVLSSTKILKSLNGRLDVDEIEEINFDLKTEIDKVDEITNVLIGDVDDSEIDEEYEKLVKETEKKEKESKKADEKKTDESKQTSDKIEQDNEKEESKHVIEDSKNEFVANKDLIDRLQNLNIESTEVKEEDPVLEPAQ